MKYDPIFGSNYIILNERAGIPRERSVLILAGAYGKEQEMVAALAQHVQPASWRTAFRRPAVDLAELLDEVCNPRQLFNQDTSYADVVFEPKADHNDKEKVLYTFDKSLKRIQQAGLERHPLPSEVFGLLIANLENKLTPQQKAVANDMLNSYGEWFSLAMLRKGNKLLLYNHPENIVWDGQKYELEGQLCHAGEQKFSVKGLPLERWIPIQKVHTKCPQLVETLWTRPYKDLPQQMKDIAGLWLPPDGQIRPVGRGSFSYGWFNVYGYGCYGRASRGVVVGAPKNER